MNTSFDKEGRNTYQKQKTTSLTNYAVQSEWLHVKECI